MKIIFSLLSILFSTLSFGQVKPNVKSLVTAFFIDPVVYFDSIPTRMGFFSLDTSAIKTITRIQGKFDAFSNSTDAIYITSKNPSDHTFLSFFDLKNKYVGNNKKPILLLMNGNFIKNPAQINIDSSFIYKIEVENGADFEELKNIYPSYSIVNIQTKIATSLNDQRNINMNNPVRQIFLNGLPNKSEPE